MTGTPISNAVAALYDPRMPEPLDRECQCLLCEGDGTPRRWSRPAARSWPARGRRNARLVREYGWGVNGVFGTIHARLGVLDRLVAQLRQR
jgi:hypothetical protein